MIGRRYWPHGSFDSANLLVQTACAMHRRGVHVEVLTPRYASSWPESIMIREVPVHRAVSAPRSEWGMGKYMRGLAAWIQQHAASFDVVFVDSIREEALVAVDVAKQLGIPTIVRCRGWGRFSDCLWWQSSRLARRCGAMARGADIVVANSASSERALLMEGFESERIERIVQGFAASPARTAARRKDARRVLASANGDLVTESDTPVVLCHATMTRDQGADLLVGTTRALLIRYPNLRIWFAGDGPHRDSMYQRLRSDGVRASIAMPGSFTDSEDLFAAADLYVQCDEEGLEYFLPTAVASGLPVVAVENTSIRSVLDAESGDDSLRPAQELEPDHRLVSSRGRPSDLLQWCPSATPKELRLAIARVLEGWPATRDRAAELRRVLLRSRPLTQTTDAYVGLVARLSQKSPREGQSRQTEAVS
jgi:glycosyltransferase involved in cell wall biosynthesis